VDIEILYVADCPNVSLARQRLDAALKAAGIVTKVRATEVADAETAERIGMRGSPTILIDGRDAVPTGAPVGSLSCRLYATDAGTQGVPTVEQLEEALAGR
jgi:hypothetical protein